ncbi:hypothetical protein [Lacticaseibacillus mingshuiensis]|uniref:hypothetical protein n=1 Tax=Lacticaseibacillus mingshuiensis TaxID=2799574 RepID=UPI0019409E42|nr:hypothetical protein [Lacticaseibacillus mingshuiensis]
MSHQMQMVLGTTYFLKQLYQKAPESLRLAEGMIQGQSSLLLDPTGSVPFEAPLRYQIRDHYQEVPQDGYLYLMYFRLNEDESSVFESQVKRLLDEADRIAGLQSMHLLKLASKHIEFVVMSTWHDKLDPYTNRSLPMVEPLRAFKHRAAAGEGYHESEYHFTTPDAIADSEEKEHRPLDLKRLFHQGN